MKKDEKIMLQHAASGKFGSEVDFSEDEYSVMTKTESGWQRIGQGDDLFTATKRAGAFDRILKDEYAQDFLTFEQCDYIYSQLKKS